VTLSVHDLSGNRIAEHDGSGAVLREYIWLGGRPLAIVEGGQTYQLHWDHILRPVMATSSTGAVVWAARYLPFGGIDLVLADTGALTQTLRFPGQWFQAETGLHQNWMRDYDPTTGRYLEADPLGLVDGPSVYGYARQSPVRYVDPRGEQTALARSLPIAGGIALADGPVPLFDVFAAAIVGVAIVYDLCTSGIDCDHQYYEIDIPTCRGISRSRGKAAAARCYASAAKRYAACLVGEPLPPLDVWNN
jgi:RHS repeat-associated protein